MANIDNIVSKLKKPPSLPNWVRLNHANRADTTRSIKNFALGQPPYSLAPIYSIITDRVTLGIDDETAEKALLRIRNPRVRVLGKYILKAVLPWLESTGMKGIEAFHNMTEMYQIGRDIRVPVKPTFVWLHDGHLEPVFVIGWMSLVFSDYQQRLLATIIHDAILTLEGFEESDAIIIHVPLIKWSKTERCVKSWKVNDQRFLTKEELQAQFDRFGKALDDAVPLILEQLIRRGKA